MYNNEAYSCFWSKMLHSQVRKEVALDLENKIKNARERLAERDQQFDRIQTSVVLGKIDQVTYVRLKSVLVVQCDRMRQFLLDHGQGIPGCL